MGKEMDYGVVSEQLTRKGYRIDYQMYLTNESDLRMTP